MESEEEGEDEEEEDEDLVNEYYSVQKGSIQIRVLSYAFRKMLRIFREISQRKK